MSRQIDCEYFTIGNKGVTGSWFVQWHNADGVQTRYTGGYRNDKSAIAAGEDVIVKLRGSPALRASMKAVYNHDDHSWYIHWRDGNEREYYRAGPFERFMDAADDWDRHRYEDTRTDGILASDDIRAELDRPRVEPRPARSIYTPDPRAWPRVSKTFDEQWKEGIQQFMAVDTEANSA